MDRIKVIRGSKIVRVTENELEKYLTKGYVIMQGEKLGGDSTQPTPKAVKEEPITAMPVAEPKSNTRAKRNRKK